MTQRNATIDDDDVENFNVNDLVFSEETNTEEQETIQKNPQNTNKQRLMKRRKLEDLLEKKRLSRELCDFTEGDFGIE